MATAAQYAILDGAVIVNCNSVHKHAVDELYVGAQSAVRAQDAALYRAALGNTDAAAEHAACRDGGFWSDRGRLVPEVAFDVRLLGEEFCSELGPQQIPA